ncbi:hypothetical protein VHEMI00050 [[Torrubiella] hemipterigena]|uniref:Low temperature requirement A n=1 Tax=[Torrubiella] hemipterigena TaxID=1531966 RepID=A0A0A1SI65_9HYPO|nr:hypothetical protein VHEMI00050 [[Torrubiella] hemipterigena]
MTASSHHERGATELGEPIKLKMFSSPLVLANGEVEEVDDENEIVTTKQFIPQLRRYEDPTLLEIFYDLFFAATYNIFCEIKETTSANTFKASIGFFCLLWLTWLAVTLFEVRYATDSIFSRVATAVQLGVLVGFVIVAPNFSPSEKPIPDVTPRVMQTMSIILAISRACLVAQYGWILLHLRKHKSAFLPLALQITVHAVSAVVLLGVSFVFLHSPPDHTYMIWYFITGADAILSVGISHMGDDTIALNSTHLMKRMALLTVMILGEGIESMAKKLIQIINGPSLLPKALNNTARGHITAVASTIYFIFLIYFDWLGPSFYLPRARQTAWVALHLPFHLCLVLFMQNFVQLLTWSTIVDNVQESFAFADPTNGTLIRTDSTSEQVMDDMLIKATNFFTIFQPTVTNTTTVVGDALANLRLIPDDFWGPYSDWLDSDAVGPAPGDSKFYKIIVDTYESLAVTYMNTIFGNFGIDAEDFESLNNGEPDPVARAKALQTDTAEHSWERYRMVFLTIFIAGGLSILFMLALKCLSSKLTKSFWTMVRINLVIFSGVAMCLVSLVWKDINAPLPAFVVSAWIAPTVALIWTFLVLLTHIDFGAVRKLPLNLNLLKYKKLGDAPQKGPRGDAWPVPSPPLKDHVSYGDDSGFYNAPPPVPYAANSASQAPQISLAIPNGSSETPQRTISSDTYGVYSSAYSPGSTAYSAYTSGQPGASTPGGSTAYTGYNPSHS